MTALVDLERLELRLARIEEHCALLDRLRAGPWDAVARDRTRTGAMEHFVQVAIQAAIDAGAQVALASGIPIGSSYGDVFRSLGENGVLEPPLARRLADAAGLRNLLVHDYLDVDEQRIFAGLEQGVSDLRAFCAAVARHADSLGSP